MSPRRTSRDLNWIQVVKPEDISIAYLWTIFAGAVMSADAPAIQREEMRKAFFSGFLECFKIINDISTALPEAEAFKVLARLRDENNAFFEKMMSEIGR